MLSFHFNYQPLKWKGGGERSENGRLFTVYSVTVTPCHGYKSKFRFVAKLSSIIIVIIIIIEKCWDGIAIESLWYGHGIQNQPY